MVVDVVDCIGYEPTYANLTRLSCVDTARLFNSSRNQVNRLLERLCPTQLGSGVWCVSIPDAQPTTTGKGDRSCQCSYLASQPRMLPQRPPQPFLVHGSPPVVWLFRKVPRPHGAVVNIFEQYYNCSMHKCVHVCARNGSLSTGCAPSVSAVATG